jgi:hypothetical protein
MNMKNPGHLAAKMRFCGTQHFKVYRTVTVPRKSVQTGRLVTGQLKCDGICSETRFCLSAKQMSPFKSAGASVQSTTGSRGVRISGSNVAYTMFRGSVKGTGYLLHSPVSPSLPSHASPCAITFQLESITNSDSTDIY